MSATSHRHFGSARAVRAAFAAALALAAASSPGAARADSAPGGASPLADDRTLVALAVSLACSDAPDEGGAPAPVPARAEPAATGPELELVATVRAKALTFSEVPRVQVRFRGDGKQHTTWKTERVNLPMRPEPGVTYRDVLVRLTITSSLDELTAMLTEAHRAAKGIVLEGPDGAVPAIPRAPPVPATPAAKAAKPAATAAR